MTTNLPRRVDEKNLKMERLEEMIDEAPAVSSPLTCYADVAQDLVGPAAETARDQTRMPLNDVAAGFMSRSRGKSAG